MVAAMFGAVFERFAEKSPVSVLPRAAMERALDPAALDALFEAEAATPYTQKLRKPSAKPG